MADDEEPLNGGRGSKESRTQQRNPNIHTKPITLHHVRNRRHFCIQGQRSLGSTYFPAVVFVIIKKEEENETTINDNDNPA
jgi:hypothetical protein